MSQNLSITLGKRTKPGLLSCKKISIREKMLCWLFGPKQNVVILVPGKTISEIDIRDINDGGVSNETV